MSGYLCYAISLDQYHNECKDISPNNTNWIVANKFANDTSNDMMHNFSSLDPDNSTVKGLIFISDTEIKSEENYKNPKIIAFSTLTNDAYL